MPSTKISPRIHEKTGAFAQALWQLSALSILTHTVSVSLKLTVGLALTLTIDRRGLQVWGVR